VEVISKGKTWYLHLKIGKGGTPLYYFTTKKARPKVPMPKGYEIVTTKSGMPLLRKKRR